ncbi:uncharacterized protein LOC141536392 [Cotesia typhae]|uniref:uncharacterized protein LOC141536392 n=1 Tax=Cotesia typhae TaxID=2053667 RepID=UPI003D684898
METYVKSAASHEREIFLSYIKDCGMVHVTWNVFSMLASIGVILGPAILLQKFPTDAKYPFPVINHPIYEIVYFDQAYAGILCSSITAIDCQLATLLWYSIARLEILGLEMKKINSKQQLNECIRKHQFLLKFIGEVIRARKYIVATTVIMTTLTVILGGVHIVGNQPMVDQASVFGCRRGALYAFVCHRVAIGNADENVPLQIVVLFYDTKSHAS